MDKIKRFIDCYVPVTTCSLRCHYCYITVHRKFEGPLPEFPYSPQQVRKALSKKRLGGTCLINFCAGGETLLTPKIVDYIKELLEEGHYIMVVTNATVTKRMDEFAAFPPELTKRLFFKFSYHYIELKERGLLNQFFTNIHTVRKAGCSFTLEVTPSDELIPYIDELKDRAIKEVGALPHVTVARDERDPNKLPILTNMSREEYIKIWSQFDSKMFEYKMSIFEKKRREFCYAGDWSFVLNLGTGIANQCYLYCRSQQNIIENPNEPIDFTPIGKRCKEHHCYNGHVWLTLGDIPELEAPYYCDIRNRKCMDGSEWLQPEMKSFMSTKLYESNDEYNWLKKIVVNMKNRHVGFRSKLKSKLFGK